MLMLTYKQNEGVWNIKCIIAAAVFTNIGVTAGVSTGGPAMGSVND